MTKTFLMRADASAQIGAGHLMRTIALGQMLFDAGHSVHFATIPADFDFIARLKGEGFFVHLFRQPFSATEDADSLVELAKQIDASWIIIDGYYFLGSYEKVIKDSLPAVSLMRIDDVPRVHHFADLLLSQNFGAEKMSFSTEPATKKMLGLEFLLLRREFREALAAINLNSKGRTQRLLVTLGGGTVETDAANLKIAEILSIVDASDLKITFIGGKMSASRQKIGGFLKSGQTFMEHTDSMAMEIAHADLAIVSGGSSMWEVMFLGVPFLAVSLTQAQDRYLRSLQEQKLCIHLGYFSDLNPLTVINAIYKLRDDFKLQYEYKSRYAKLIDSKNLGKHLIDVLTS
jgi:UDP-2,4-diacetamido-2,4,6-trideoxy-beta-L-altropyranose hydrolase